MNLFFMKNKGSEGLQLCLCKSILSECDCGSGSGEDGTTMNIVYMSHPKSKDALYKSVFQVFITNSYSCGYVL